VRIVLWLWPHLDHVRVGGEDEVEYDTMPMR
jgi:hypothetical protein